MPNDGSRPDRQVVAPEPASRSAFPARSALAGMKDSKVIVAINKDGMRRSSGSITAWSRTYQAVPELTEALGKLGVTTIPTTGRMDRTPAGFMQKWADARAASPPVDDKMSVNQQGRRDRLGPDGQRHRACGGAGRAQGRAQ
jgi:hypothetical protein